jgi:hypothetical protein
VRPSPRPYLIAAAAGLVFGGADQYLGSRVTLGLWASSLSGMSAPWLLLPFLCGLAQAVPRRAALAGLTVTVAALVGYFALTLSPLEGVALASVPAASSGCSASAGTRRARGRPLPRWLPRSALSRWRGWAPGV